MTISFPPINYPNKPVPPFTAPPPRNPFPGFFPYMWENITGKPYITVSSKGLANGLSEYFNDGADFGPDSLQADGSLTQTSGIQEAVNYAISQYQEGPTSIVCPSIQLLFGQFIVNKGINISPFTPSGVAFNGFAIYGIDQMLTYIGVNTTDDLFFMDPNWGGQLTLADMQPYVVNGINPSSILNWNPTSTGSQTLIIQHLNGSSGGWVNGTLYVSHLSNIVMFDHERYGTGVNINNCNLVTDIGGTNDINPYGYVNNGTEVLSKITNCDRIYISGAWIGWYDFGGSGSVKIDGNNFQGLVLSGNVSIIEINSDTPYILSGDFTSTPDVPALLYNISGGTITIGKLSIKLGYGTPQSGVTFSNGNITYSDVDIELYGILGQSVPSSVVIPFNKPALPANPPASATVYQNTNPYDIRLKIPITYNPSTTAAATLATGISSSSTVTTSIKTSLPSGLTAADGQILTYDMVVPAGWYFELVTTNATIGTVEVEAA